MTTRLRFHLDENTAAAVADGLRRRGHDVTTAAEVGLISADDKTHLAFALAASRVTVTHDSDFLRLHASGRPHAGIAFCASDTRSVGQILRSLIALANRLDAMAMHNRV